MTAFGALVPILSRHPLNENEQRAFGGWINVFEPAAEDYVFIQTQLPLGIQRAATVLNRSAAIELDDSRLVETQGERGFYTQNELADRFGSGVTSGTTPIDVVMVTTDQEIHLVEIKTANEPIDGAGDAHEAFGQLLMYRDRFEEDYPRVAEEYAVRCFVLAEQSGVDPPLLRPSFLKRDFGFFDPTRGGFLISPPWVDAL